MTGLAPRVLPQVPPALPQDSIEASPQDPPPPAAPVSVDELFRMMDGAVLYIDAFRPYNLPSFMRVVIHTGLATVEYPFDYAIGGRTYWAPACAMTAVNPMCSGNKILGIITVTPAGFAWRYDGQVYYLCDANPDGRGGGVYTYQHWLSRAGQFADYAGSGLSGYMFQDAWLENRPC
ncbi:hypothetical protein [Pigmentiphaga soli]|uniref:hypothetical protein n=1 Tax=Pigmentiphaga soli TaxID=1007095 RepID=UPI0031F0229C